ncbi:hypothetical protein Lalb_Chr06g0172161 [Lupinus albus]|uniref:Uncharacterized protein n=1 Tax=Lupinus albus TaxID=3870 RepID=A0A6A4QE85_LUPAL|nr:hypothetical protein Lalb_Chr06g0172161 [Lupinus albus]
MKIHLTHDQVVYEHMIVLVQSTPYVKCFVSFCLPGFFVRSMAFWCCLFHVVLLPNIFLTLEDP